MLSLLFFGLKINAKIVTKDHFAFVGVVTIGVRKK